MSNSLNIIVQKNWMKNRIVFAEPLKKRFYLLAASWRRRKVSLSEVQPLVQHLISEAVLFLLANMDIQTGG